MNNNNKTIEELEKYIKILCAKYYQTIDKLGKALASLKMLLSDLSQKQEGASDRKDLIELIRANFAYMNLLSLTRSYLASIRSSNYYLQVLRNTEVK